MCVKHHQLERPCVAHSLAHILGGTSHVIVSDPLILRGFLRKNIKDFFCLLILIGNNFAIFFCYIFENTTAAVYTIKQKYAAGRNTI